MKALSSLLCKLKADQRGTALIELAVVLPVLLGICLGVFEFGNAIYSRHLIENGVRDAARFASGMKFDYKTCTIPADTQTKTQYVALTGIPTANTNYRVSYWNPSTTGFVFTVGCLNVANGPTSCGSTRCYRGPDNIAMVTVSTDIPYQGIGFLGYFGLSAPTMHISHQERLYGIR